MAESKVNDLLGKNWLRPGELVAFDTDMCGPFGYFADFSRTYLCGDGAPNEEQREAYGIAYDFIYESLEYFQPGAAFREVAEKCPALPEAYKYQRYPMIAHGDGMSDEWPCVYWPDQSWGGFGSDDDVLQQNMVLSVEVSRASEALGRASSSRSRSSSPKAGRRFSPTRPSTNASSNPRECPPGPRKMLDTGPIAGASFGVEVHGLDVGCDLPAARGTELEFTTGEHDARLLRNIALKGRPESCVESWRPREPGAPA